MSEEEQIKEMARDLQDCIDYDEWAAREYGETYVDYDSTAFNMVKLGYRKQVEGKWVDQYQGMYENQLYKCSVCEETAFHDDKRWFLTNYCPNCGASMKGV